MSLSLPGDNNQSYCLSHFRVKYREISYSTTPKLLAVPLCTIRHAVTVSLSRSSYPPSHSNSIFTRARYYAPDFVLDEPAIDKVMVGCTEPEQVLDAIDIFTKHEAKTLTGSSSH
jgi:hypothetical protein